MANKRLNAVITIGGAVAGSLRNAFGTVTSETSKVGAAIQRLTERQRQLNAELERAGRNGSNAAGARMRVFYAQQEADAIGRQIAALRHRERLERAQGALKTQRGELRGKIGGTLATAAAVAAPLGLAVNRAAAFDYELQLIGNTADMNKRQVGELGATIVRVSKDTQQSATNIRKGMGFLIAAGMKPDQATQFLGAIGKTATASNADVEDLSKMVFTLADSLKIQPGGMLAAIDTLTQAGKEGNVELKDMAKQLPVLGSGFVSLKMQGREAAATMGAALQIARKGAADADEAANNMKNYIAKIMSPETLKKAKKHFNLDLYKVIQDAQKSGGNPFEASLQAIAKATKGDQKAIGEMFSDMQVQNFLRPMIQNWKEYGEIKAKALSADGVVDRDFTSITATAQQQMNELGNAAERLGIALGSVFSAGSGDKATSMSARIGQLAEFITQHRELVAVTFKVVGGLFAMRLAVLGVAYAWNMAKAAWVAGRLVMAGMAGAELAAGAAGWVRVGAAIRFVGTSLLWVGRALLLNPIGLAVTAIAAAAFLIYKNWEPIKAWFGNLWDGIKTTFAGVWDWIVGKVGWLIDAPGKIAAKVRGIIGGGAAAQDSSGGYDAMGNPTGGGLPSVPPMASRGGTTVLDNSQTTIHVTQQPGQDAKALAEEIERRRRQAAGVRARSSLVDGVGAQ